MQFELKFLNLDRMMMNNKTKQSKQSFSSISLVYKMANGMTTTTLLAP